MLAILAATIIIDNTVSLPLPNSYSSCEGHLLQEVLLDLALGSQSCTDFSLNRALGM